MANEVNDFSVANGVTAEQMAEFFRQQRELESTNIIRLAGKVLSKRQTEPRPKMRADENGKFVIPMLTDDGDPLFWDSMYYIILAFEGGNIEINIPKEWDTNIGVNSRILVEGSKLADKKGIVKDSFHRYTLLV